MTDQKIPALINLLRYSNNITPLQKDILDTWDALKKEPFNADDAQKQIVSNNRNHPDLFAAISAIPGVIKMPFSNVTQEDMTFNLRCQLEGLAAKEMEARLNGKNT